MRQKPKPLGKRALFSFESAGRVLSIDPDVLKRAVLLGQVNAIEIGQRRLIPRSEIERLAGCAIEDLK